MQNPLGISKKSCTVIQTQSNDVFEMLSRLLVTIAKSENILEGMREVLVQIPTFSPNNLFRYLGTNSNSVTYHNLIKFLDENNLVQDEKQSEELLIRIFRKHGITKKSSLNFQDFIQFIYPYDTGVLRDISNNKMKKYEEINKLSKGFRPSDDVITAFLLILEEEIKSQRRIQAQINDERFPNKQKLKKVIKSIQRASQKSKPDSNLNTEQLQMQDLRTFINAFISMQDHLFLDLARSLGMDNKGNIPVESILSTLKKRKRIGWDNGSSNQNTKQLRMSKLEKSRKQAKYQKQITFKEQLYRELEQTLKPASPRNKTPRNRSRSQKAKSSRKREYEFKHEVSGLGSNFSAFDHCDNLVNENQLKGFMRRQNQMFLSKCKQQTQNNNMTNARKSSVNNKNNQEYLKVNTIYSLFIDFISVFLKGNQQIQEVKNKLQSLGSIDFLELFKNLDNGKGVLDSQDLKIFYQSLSGLDVGYDFQLLVNRFAQPEERTLTYSEFCDIFGSSSDTGSLSASPELSPEQAHCLAQILYMNLILEQDLKEILERFQSGDREYLFSQINTDSESKGFINYQELKKFINDRLGLNLSMQQLMALLKRLDRGRNGVVVREDFLSN